MAKNASPSTKTSSSSEIDVEKGHKSRSKKKEDHESEKAENKYLIDGTCFHPCEMHEAWKTEESETPPYLAHVKRLSAQWKSLHQLDMFMEAGTTPAHRWHLKEDNTERLARLQRTNVTLIEYGPQGKPNVTSITKFTTLADILGDLGPGNSAQTSLRLFIVEDLSREVIEQLGARFDVDPLFFREHIHDYVWLNMRDSWATPPSLTSSTRRRSWFRLRNVRLRYHTSKESYKRAQKEVENWNIQRRPDDDRNHWAHNDEVKEDDKGEEISKAVVSILRTRTTIWIGKDRKCGDGTVGIVLLDPSLKKEGKPLWYDRQNWLPTTSMPESQDSSGSTQLPERPAPELSWYEDIVTKTEAYLRFEAESSRDITPHVLALPTLYTICAEWLIVCDYVRARLSQIEWEIEMPKVFRSKKDPNDKRSNGEIIADSLERLHTWRRHIPVFRDMVTEAVQQALPAAARLTTSTPLSSEYAIDEMKPDFELILNNLDALQQRVDRLTTVVTSEINIVDSQQSLQDNHNLARLTWLAAIFIPLSFVSTLFSMNESVAALKYTYGWFFLTAIPFTAVCILVVQMSGGGVLGKKVMKKKDSEPQKETLFDRFVALK